MTSEATPPAPAPAPVAHVRRRTLMSAIWLVPIVAAAIVLYLLITSIESRGPLITITFATAEGLSAGQTQVKHRDVALGVVDDIRLSDDLSHVIVRVRMNANARKVLTDRARFWVVRPRLSPGTLSTALETLVSGAYIQVDPGPPGGQARFHFAGLEQPPGVRSDEPGRTFVLETDDLGPLSIGAPVSYRGTSAGEVLGYALEGAQGPFAIRIFVRSPFDTYVHPRTRFWAESGATLGMGPQGLRLELAPLQALLSGGVQFETPPGNEEAPASEPGAKFHLYSDRAQADATTFESIPCASYFRDSTQGLGVGSPVQIFGFTVGSVTNVRLVSDPAQPQHFAARVEFNVQPDRLAAPNAAAYLSYEGLRSLVADEGLRVVLDSSSFVTGQKTLSLEEIPGVSAAVAGREDGALLLPSQPGGAGDIGSSIQDVAKKLDRIPFREIGVNLDAVLRSVNRTVSGPEMHEALRSLSATLGDVHHLTQEADAGLAPALQRLPDISDQLQQAAQRVNAALGERGYGQDSDFQRHVERLLHQVDETARSVRLLADFLDRHPESILRGRSEGKP